MHTLVLLTVSAILKIVVIQIVSSRHTKQSIAQIPVLH
jgi:hypothetical protein